MANDIQNLLSRFGATSECYLEVDDVPQYREPLQESPPPGVTKAQPRQAQVHVVAVPEQVVAAPAAVARPEAVGNIGDSDGRGAHAVAAGNHVLLRSLLEELARTRKGHSVAGGTHRRTAARVIAVVSIKGGVGKSTLSAALAGAVDGAGRRIALDLDPQDALRYHLGAEVPRDDDRVGVTAADWKAGLLEGHAGVQVLAYGAVSATRQRALEHALDQAPEWLVRKLAAMHLDSADVVVLDTPTGRTPWLEQALSAADLVVVVIMPDAASFMVLEQTEQVFERVLGEEAAARCVYVVNQFDATRAFHLDMLDILRRCLGERLIGVVPFDEKVAEGLALGTYPLFEGSTSRAGKAMEDIAQVLRTRLNVSVTHGHAL